MVIADYEAVKPSAVARATAQPGGRAGRVDQPGVVG